MRIIGINGIHSHGAAGTDKALADLAKLGHETIDYGYPKRNSLSAWRRKIRWDDARGLLEEAEDGDHLVCHSYGCLIALEAMRMNMVRFGQVFFFGAAASSDRYPWFPLGRDVCQNLYVIYNPEDRALKLGALLFNHPFGRLGIKGYRGPRDSRIKNRQALIDNAGLLDHNGHLDDAHRESWVGYINGKIQISTL